MARLTIRLMLTAIVFGVALGILYSLALGFRRPQQLALPHLRHAKGLGMRLRHHHRHRHARRGRAKAGDSAQAAAAAAAAGSGAGAEATVAGDEGQKPLTVQAEAQEQQQQQQPSLGAKADGEASSAQHDSTTGGIASVTAAAADAGVSDGASGSALGNGEDAAATGAAAAAAAAGTEAAAGAGTDEGRVDPSVPLPRVCGSPAVDGYAHVDPKCLEKSPTNRLWWQQNPGGGKSGEGLECNVERAVSLDGLAVGWGIGNKKDTPEECCQACRDHRPGPQIGGPFGNLPCNVWVWCSEDVCYEADAHHHTKGDCWLKFSEAPQSPEVNARGDFTDAFKQRHPDAPQRCQWVSGVLVPPGQKLTNGTWGPRFDW